MAPAALDTAAIAAGGSVADTRRALAGELRRAGIDSPELDARLLVGFALKLDRTGLSVESNRKVSGTEARLLGSLAARRLAGEPVARITGVKEFWGLPLRVTASTLVPRPETETVVEVALFALGADRARALRIADLGTGSGALLLALLTELPAASGIGTDLSTEALAVARDNATRHGLLARAQFAACDFGAALGGGFDIVVSNPPYVASGEIAALPPEVRCDPHGALDGGSDGLDCYRVIARQAPALLAPAGHLVVELGRGQERAVAELFHRSGLAPAAARADLAGIPRALHARLPQ